MPKAADAHNVTRHATLRYHAGEITFDEWSACIREFRTGTTAQSAEATITLRRWPLTEHLHPQTR